MIEMKYDEGKIDEMTLAMLYLTTFDDKNGKRAWKGLSWEVMGRLHEKGYIGNPKSKAKSVTLSEDGAKLSEELFKKFFGLTD